MIIPAAKADGVIIPPYYDEPIPENSQLAAINYEDGLEKMIIAVNFDMRDYAKAVWIVPVPAKPERVVIDVLSKFPRFYGEDVVERAESGVDDIITLTQLTQIYPLLLWFPFYGAVPMAATRTATTPEGAVGGTVEGVTVYEYIEKEGVSVEVVTTESAAALYSHLRSKGVTIQEGALTSLNGYIGEDYTFVVSWISLPEAVVVPTDYSWEYPYRMISPYMRQPGVFVTFPTDKIYYPLVPTSAYGSTKIPVVLYVLGHVTPDAFNEIRSYTRTNYFVQDSIESWGLEDFFGGVETSNLKYTKVEISAPSKYFVEDLTFTGAAPAKVSYATALYALLSSSWLSGVVILLGMSALAGAITGFLVFKEPKRFALVGLFNLFTIIGLAIAVASTKTRSSAMDERFKRMLERSGVIAITADKKKIVFVVLFSIIFLVVGAVAGYLLKLPLLV
jgi:hypothetical protein